MGKKQNSNHFIENVRHVILRGGRMAKHKGQAVSYAPMLGTLAVALMSSASVMLVGTSAVAGTCTETGGAGSGIWSCTGAAATDTTQTPTAATNGALTVTTSTNFGINTISGNALNLKNAATNTGITFTDTKSATITGAAIGIRAYNYGTAAVSVTSTGAVTGASKGIGVLNHGTDLTVKAAAVTGGYGVSVNNKGSGATSVTTTGAVIGTSGIGIRVDNTGTDLTVKAAAVTGDSYGIWTNNKGSGATSVTATGTVTTTTTTTLGMGIWAYNSSTTIGGLVVKAVAVHGRNVGIKANNGGSGVTSVTTTGAVTGGERRDLCQDQYRWS